MMGALAVAAWLAGLFVFAQNIPREAEASQDKTDAMPISMPVTKFHCRSGEA